MIVVKMTMTVLPEKRLEMLQTLVSMIEPVEREAGCLNHSVLCDARDENRFFIMETWEKREDLERHIATDRFTALLGARILLRESPGVEIYTVTKSEGMEVVFAARGKE